MSKRGIDGDLVGIDDVTVVDPDLPAWHIIQRTTHQGRTYKVYHGPLGEYAESKKQAILLSSGVPLSAAMLAPKTRPAPGVRLVDAKSAASHQGSPARAPRAVSPLLAYDGGGASPLLDPVDDEPNPGSQALRTAKTRFKELNDSCVDCVVRVSTSEIVDESSALYLNGGDGDGDGEGEGGAAEGAEGGGEAAAVAEGAAEGSGAGGAGAGDGAPPAADTSNDAAIAAAVAETSVAEGRPVRRAALAAGSGAQGSRRHGESGYANKRIRVGETYQADVPALRRGEIPKDVRPGRPGSASADSSDSPQKGGGGDDPAREGAAVWNGRALDDSAVSDYIRAATAKLKDGADITKAADGAAADGAAAAFSAAIDGAAAERAVDALSAAGQESALCLLHEHGYRPDAALAELGGASVPPVARAGWSARELLAFDSGLASHGKDFTAIVKALPGRGVTELVRMYYERKCGQGRFATGDPNFLYARPVVVKSQRRGGAPKADEEADGDGAAGDCGAPGPAPMLMEGVAVVPADDAATNGAPMEVDGVVPDGAAAAP